MDHPTHLNQFKKGMMFRVEKTIPLENIQDLTFLDNPFLRWFDLRCDRIAHRDPRPLKGGKEQNEVTL